MKTSTWIIIGVLGYLWYKSKTPTQTSSPIAYGPPLLLGPPATSFDPCNGFSTNFDPQSCTNAGRTVYYQVDASISM
jgi:hypothetical protein